MKSLFLDVLVTRDSVREIAASYQDGAAPKYAYELVDKWLTEILLADIDRRNAAEEAHADALDEMGGRLP